MHRIHCAYLTHASDISKFWLGKSFISASTIDQSRSNLFLANAPIDSPKLFGRQAATAPAAVSSLSPEPLLADKGRNW
jgi:hypothetical protein